MPCEIIYTEVVGEVIAHRITAAIAANNQTQPEARIKHFISRCGVARGIATDAILSVTVIDL